MKRKDVKFFFYMTIFFVIVIFITNSFLYKEDSSHIEETYIDKQIWEYIKSLSWANITNNVETSSKKALINHIQNKKETLNSASRLEIVFEPTTYKKNIDKSYYYLLQEVFDSSFFDNVFWKNVDIIYTYLHQNKEDVRWKMQNKSIHIFDPESMKKWEFLRVYIHELGHYIDLYFFQKDVIWDDSNDFYDISWKDVKIIKSWSKSDDFVSGYAMTNKYEDFAESFTYYVLHNKAFLEKAWKNEKLVEKYKFFSEKLFKNGQFKDTSFAQEDLIKDYYWDITKININYNNFLEYLKK